MTIFPAGLKDSNPVSGAPSLIQALEELGLDTVVDFIDEPLLRHRALWTTVADEAADAYDRFQQVIPRVLELAYDEHLARNVHYLRVSGRHRRDIIEEFQQQIRARNRAFSKAAEAAAAN